MSLYSLYGPHYEDFAKQSRAIVQKTVEAIQHAVDQEKNLSHLFLSIVSDMGEWRHTLAKEHQVKKVALYGKRRDLAEEDCAISITLFCDHTVIFERRLTKQIQGHLQPIHRTHKAFQQTTLEVNLPPCCDRSSKVQYEVLNEHSKPEYFNTDWNLEYINLCTITGKPLELPLGKEVLQKFANDRDSMVKLKKSAPDLYKKFKVLPCITELRNLYPQSKMSDWILATHRISIDGQMVALSQNLTWAFRNLKDDPIERMLDYSVTLIIRQDRFLIPFMLIKIASLFEKAIQCHRYDLEQIKNETALIKYLFIQAMPFLKGTSTISEWIEQAIYSYHGYTVAYTQKKMASNEALISTWNDFHKNYDTIYTLSTDLNAPD